MTEFEKMNEQNNNIRNIPNLTINYPGQESASHITKLVQYKSIAYPHSNQSARIYGVKKAAKINYAMKSIRNNSGDISTNLNSATYRSGIPSQIESEGTNRPIKNSQRYQNTHHKDESFYEIPQVPHKKRINTSQKRYLFTHQSDSENVSIQDQEFNVSTDNLRGSSQNHITNGSVTYIKGVKHQLSFKGSLKNSYVSIENRDDIALAKKIEVILCSRNQSRRSMKEQQELNSSQVSSQNKIFILNSKKNVNNNNHNNSNTETEQIRLTEQSQFGQSVRLKTANKPYNIHSAKQNQTQDTEINQNSSKQEIFNYLKNKIFSKEVTQPGDHNKKQKKQSYYFHKLDSSDEIYTTNVFNTSITSQNYTPPPQISDLVSMEQRARLTQSQGRRGKKQQNFYEKFSQKLKDSLLMAESMQSHQTESYIQNNRLSQWNNQPIIKEKGQTRYLQSQYNPIKRGRRILSSLDDQYNSNQCEKIVANYVNKSIYGDSLHTMSHWRNKDDKNETINSKVGFNHSNTINNNNNHNSNSLKTETIDIPSKFKEKEDPILSESQTVKNVFYSSSKIKTESNKQLQALPQSRNSSQKIINQNSNKSIKLSSRSEENNKTTLEAQNSVKPLIFYQNKQPSNEFDDPDLREYLSEHQGFPKNIEVLGSDYS